MSREGLYVTAIGPRADEFRGVFGTNRLPVLSLSPVNVELEKAGTRQAYMLDVARMEPSQIDALVAHLASNFPDSAETIREYIFSRGFPITVDENLVGPAIDMRLLV
jgi:hypothetical protein